MPKIIRLAFIAAALLMGAPAAAQGDLEILPVQGNVFMIAGPEGNTTVQVGDEAVVVVDTQTPEVTEQLLEAIGRLSPQPIRHIILTSDAPEHTGGNEQVSRAGTYVRLIDSFDPRGSSTDASIMAHVNLLARMASPPPGAAAIPSGAWPTDTYFTNEWALFVNGEAIQLLHVPAAHSDGDTIVFFRRSDVVSTGNIYVTTGYPEFNPDRGGSIGGVIEGLNRILDITIAGENQEGGTAVVPGRGRISDETDVANYRDMVTIVRSRIAALVAQGMTLEQVQAARPTLDYDGIYDRGDGWTAQMFVAAIYSDLTRGEQ
jgi:cyclase